MRGWLLSIDFGTTSTAAARRVGDRVELIQIHGAPRMPSAALWREGSDGTSGRLVLGEEAEELAALAPWALERNPKNRLGEEFIQLGEKQLRPVEIVAGIFSAVMEEALVVSGGEPPEEVRLTYPARWTKARLDRLLQAASLAGIQDPTLIPEPVAAAMHFASAQLSEGEHVAVYDLGGGTLDTAVLRRTADGFEVIGRPGGNEELGGEDFDQLLFTYFGNQLDGESWKSVRTSSETRNRGWGQAAREMRRHSRFAKERLSRNTEYDFYLGAPVDQELHVDLADFEAMILSDLKGTVSELERTILAAGLKVGDIDAIYLAGGSSRIPLVRKLIQQELGIPPQHLDDPKAVIALGAAAAGGISEGGPGVTAVGEDRPVPVPPPPATPVPAPPAPPIPPRPEPPRPGAPEPVVSGNGSSNRGRIMAIAGGAVALVVVAVVALLLLGGGDSESTSTDPDPEPEPPAFAESYSGTVDGGGNISVTLDPEGLVTKVRAKYGEQCDNGGEDKRVTTFSEPFTEQEPGSFSDSDVTRFDGLDKGQSLRTTANIAGSVREDESFAGTLNISNRFTKDGAYVTTCESGTVDWSATPDG